MTTYTEQLRRLLEGLYLRTMEKKIRWTYDESTDSCEASLGRGYVELAGETDQDGDYSVLVKLLNADKQVIDRIYGGSYGLHEHVPFNTGHKTYWVLMTEIKNSAERSALGSDEVIDSMISGLASDVLPLSDDDEIPF